ncbi:MAG: hypothetical protein QY326_04955 [Bdellovibrionota bacterium]|nr:MAG: hypothetical protein QY326_04955 [Bdellovibrionota bacterium]
MTEQGKVVYSGVLSPHAAQRSIVRHLIAGAACVLLLFLGTYLWFMRTLSFPKLEVGQYFGSVRGVFGEGPQEEVPLFIERRAHSNDLFVVLFKPGWSPLFVNVALDGNDERSEWILPLTISHSSARLRFTGQRITGRLYRGEVLESESGRSGEWQLETLQAAPLMQFGANAPDLRHWLFLFDELHAVESELKELTAQLEREEQEVARLSTLITEREQLRARSEAKYAEVSSAFDSASGRLDKTRQSVEALGRNVSMAHKVTPMGRLVTLSRESLERESRWIESMLRTTSPALLGLLDVDVAKSDRLTELKTAILNERKALLPYLRLEQQRRRQQ